MTRLERLQSMLAENEGDAFLRFAIAKEYEGMGDDAEALRHFEMIREKQPDYVGLYYHLGKLLERLSRPAEAFQTYAAGMEVARAAGDSHALGELAGAKLELGDEEDFAGM